jgi:hypothetical protein
MVWVTRDATTNILGADGAYVAMSGLAAALNLEVAIPLDGGDPVGDTVVYVLHWEVPYEDVGNEIQGDTAELDITFTLTQS